MMELTEDQLEKINFLMKAMIIATTIFFFLAFIVIFFGLFGIPPQTSQNTLLTLSPVVFLLVVFSLVFNITRYRCPECRTFIKRSSPCPVCASIRQSRGEFRTLIETETKRSDSFLQENASESTSIEKKTEKPGSNAESAEINDS
ncbi:MAG: hypothetical protein ACFFD4_31535 [Candidatus Odinarchaeota archaeon]